jgi:hypothetical protein
VFVFLVVVVAFVVFLPFPVPFHGFVSGPRVEKPSSLPQPQPIRNLCAHP